jgi:hypothetical protein
MTYDAVLTRTLDAAGAIGWNNTAVGKLGT